MRHNRHLFAISTNIAKRFFCDAAKKEKKHSIAVVGAAGGCGQPLSLLLKLNPSIGELRLHDIQNIAGVAMDLSHIETASKVLHSSGTEYCEALKGGVDIIVLVAGNPRKPDQKREDLFNINAPFAFKFAEAVAKHSPDAILLIISNPVNSIVPLICEVLKNQKKFCPGKVLGVTTLDSVRAATFIAELTCMDPKDVTVPVIGGHSVHTIIPLISKTNPKVCIEGEKLCKLVKRIQESGTEIVKAKEGKGSSSLSTAYAASRLIFALLRALNGESNIVESAYVMSDVHPDVKYFATPLILGKNGVEKNLGIGTALSDYEQKMLCEAITHLKKEIEVGESFAKAEICNKGKNKVPIPVPAAPAAAAVTGKK